MIDQATIEEFKANLRGQLIQPGDEGYDEACKIYNAMIERRPGLISRCADVADVMAAINIARENDLLVAIRGGATTVQVWARATMVWSSTCHPLSIHESIRKHVPYRLEGVVHGEMWTMQLMLSA